jgi:hypothetical protein
VTFSSSALLAGGSGGSAHKFLSRWLGYRVFMCVLAECKGNLRVAVGSCLERVDQDVGQRGAECVGNIEAERILQPR